MPHSLPASLRLLSVLALSGTLALAACADRTGSGGPPPTPAPSSTPTPGPSTPLALCTTSGAPQSLARATSQLPRRLYRTGFASGHVPGVIEVTYERGTFSRVRPQIGADRTLDFPQTDRVVQVLHVDPSQEQATLQRLRSLAYVKSVSFAAYRRLQSTTASSAFTNDPFFLGFAPGNVPPLYESSATGGQWDIHAICAANAWAYGKSNTTGRTFPGALGGTMPIAVIDTGADLTHPELVNVTFAETVLNGAVTVGLAGMHDNDGHGTDVAGIAAAAGNNGFGFTGVAYAAPLQIYKVFPDPPTGGCAANSTSAQCTALGSDVAIAINDAVTHGAKVINLSLGDTQSDAAEESAVANAIAGGVVVVAASGNGTGDPAIGQPKLDYPAVDPGVIAVGASAIDDSNPSAIAEKVAFYSNYDNANSAAWGVVAPGGDPCSGQPGTTCNDNDLLHWIENIYTSTASDGSSNSACRPDPNAVAGANDCRILIAGTSQATPHVSGAASLLLSAGAQPSQIKTLLCSTASPIAGGKAGCGRLNVYKAMAQAVGDPSP
ncbi:MAG TPA: S8 family serine peptidase [Candidatus Baltobacteraceae bacterium]|nr:S8 family serine peptidase [Candidatus Baltobacteraceae bacterium]